MSDSATENKVGVEHGVALNVGGGRGRREVPLSLSARAPRPQRRTARSIAEGSADRRVPKQIFSVPSEERPSRGHTVDKSSRRPPNAYPAVLQHSRPTLDKSARERQMLSASGLVTLAAGALRVRC